MQKLIKRLNDIFRDWYFKTWPGNTEVIIWQRFNPYSEYVTVYEKFLWDFLVWHHRDEYYRVMLLSGHEWHGSYYRRRKRDKFCLVKDAWAVLKIMVRSQIHYYKTKYRYERLS